MMQNYETILNDMQPKCGKLFVPKNKCGLYDIIPAEDFSAENTVKDAIDDLQTDTQDKIDIINGRIRNINDNIDDLESIIPSSRFSAQSTVKDYIDNEVSEVADLLPASAFDSVNTVRGALNGRVRAFETVADMTVATDLATDMICHTNGFHTSGDGGAAFYEIKSTGTANAMDIIACQNSLLAHLVIAEPFVTPEMFGAYGDGTHDDTSVLQYVISNNNDIHFTNEYLASNIEITGSFKNLCGGKFIIPQNDTLFIIDSAGSNHKFENMLIEGSDYSQTAFKLSTSTNVIRWQTSYINLRVKKCAIVENIIVENKTNHSSDGYGSENTWIGCKFYDNQTVIKCNNSQSVNNTLLNCSCEHERNNVNSYPLFDITSGGFNFVGCSIITNYIAFNLSFDYATPTTILNLNSCRFELITNSAIGIKTSGTSASQIIYVRMLNTSSNIPAENTKLIDLDSRGYFNIDNLQANPYQPIVYAHNRVGATVGSTGERTSYIKINNANVIPELETINATEMIVNNSPIFENSTNNKVTSNCYNNSGMKEPILIQTRPYSPGNRIGILQITAPKQYRIESFGIKPAGTYAVTGQTLNLYALPDSMDFSQFDPANNNVILLGSATTTATEWEFKPTTFLSNTIIGYAADYTQGKYVLTGKQGGSDCLGTLYVKFE